MSRFLRLPTFIAAGLLAAALTIVLILAGGIGTAQADTPITVDGGWQIFNWSSSGQVFSEEGPFTFTAPGAVEVKVTDAFCAGDEFRIFDFDVQLGDTSAVTSDDCATSEDNPDAAFADPAISSGTFPLGPGDHSITIQLIVNPFAGGAGFIRVDSVPTITLEPPEATNTIGADHTVTATVEEGGGPLDADVEFEVTDGPNAGDSGSDSTDVNGEATFTYTGDGGAGTDTIEACVVDFPELCATATKDWVEPAATATPTPTPTPTALAATATPAPTPVVLPASGGTPSDGGSGALPWLAAIAGAIALIGSGGAWFAHQRRRVR